MPDRLLLESRDWQAELLPGQGGACAALRWRGLDLLVPLPEGADPNASFAGAFVMAPWANRLDGGALPVAGTTWRLPINRPEDDTAIHGLSRDAPWAVAASGAAHAVLEQEVDATPLGAPWRYRARMEWWLDAESLRLALTLTNLGELPFPFGLGWHPFFARPAGTRLRLAADTLFARDERSLPVAAQPSTGIDGAEPAYEGLDTAFAGWDGAAEIIRDEGRLRLSASGAWARCVQVFAPAGSHILCVEPVSHVPDAPNRPALAPHGPLLMRAPGESLRGELQLRMQR
ncbi:aldose epimerase [Siccirubricoccus sp. KC 17139]|uniref:Aldose epimerase n=1 Tax=Siccirubricoccus soli TaxID=2899147 RepID=A0ABT1DAG7_9PROT|nr:aldose epimerase [Siccirubricoccus soli]MCO6418184.1 aldose epimerase [Siccirubricoccus soli]MCP2684319.1 aldose epimerase [Siccirubricoccus soli]